MSIYLEIALIMASFSVILLVVFLIPTVLQIKRQMNMLSAQSVQLQAKVEVLVNEGNELVQNVNQLVIHLNHQVNNVSEIVGTVQHWTDRTNRIVDEIGSVIEPPIFSMAEKINLFRRGVGTFLQVLLRPKSN